MSETEIIRMSNLLCFPHLDVSIRDLAFTDDKVVALRDTTGFYKLVYPVSRLFCMFTKVSITSYRNIALYDSSLQEHDCYNFVIKWGN